MRTNIIRRRRLAPGVALSLGQGDEQLHLSLLFDFNAIALIEERTGLGVLNGEIWNVVNPGAPFVKRSPAKTLLTMLWAASLACQPELDSEEAFKILASYVDFADVPRIAAALSEAFLASLPKEQRERIAAERESEDAAPLAKATNTDGSASGPSPDTTSDSATKSSAA